MPQLLLWSLLQVSSMPTFQCTHLHQRAPEEGGGGQVMSVPTQKHQLLTRNATRWTYFKPHLQRVTAFVLPLLHTHSLQH